MANWPGRGGAGQGGAGWGEPHHAVVRDLQDELAVAVPIFHDVPCLRKQVRRSASGDGRTGLQVAHMRGMLYVELLRL